MFFLSFVLDYFALVKVARWLSFEPFWRKFRATFKIAKHSVWEYRTHPIMFTEERYLQHMALH